jgi:hypothetical protein
LGDYLLSFHPDFESPELTEQAAYAIIFPDKEFSMHEFNRYASKLYQLVEHFIEIESIEQFKYIIGQSKSEFFYLKNAESLFEKSQKSFDKFLKKQEKPNSTSFFYTYLNKKLSYNYWAFRKPGEKTDRIYTSAFHALDAYYLTELLMASTILQYQQRRVLSQEEMPLLKPALEYLKTHYETQPPLLQAWYLPNVLLENREEKARYVQLKEVLLEHLPILPDLDARNLVGIAKTAVRHQHQLSRQEHLEEYFFWNTQEIAQGWIYADNSITNTQLGNVITVALALGKTAWAAEFLENSKPYLVPATLEDTYQYNLARIRFAEGNFQESLKQIAMVSYLDEYMALRVKRLELKVYYELDEHDAFEATLNSFRVYSHRVGKKHPKLKELQNNFSVILNLLHKKKVDLQEDTTKAQLHEMVISNPQLPEYEWMVEKVQMLQ